MKKQFPRFFCSTNSSISSLFKGIRLVLMDVDDTMFQSPVAYYRRHLNEVVTAHTNKSPWSEAQFIAHSKTTIEKHGRDFISHFHIVAAMMEVHDENHPDVAYVTEQYFTQFKMAEITPPLFPGFREFMGDLKRSQIPVLAVSNNDFPVVEALLSKHDIHEDFAHVIGSAQKPKPDIVHKILHGHEILSQNTGEHVLVIGDSLSTDGRLAKNIGSPFVLFTGGYSLDQLENSRSLIQSQQEAGLIPLNTFIVNDFTQLRSALKELEHDSSLPARKFC